jgi:hypothetical protein
MSDDKKSLVKSEPEADGEHYGPAMLALKDDRERNFVIALFEAHSAAEAMRIAGYAVGGTPETHTRMASRKKTLPRIVDAMMEHQRALIRTEGPAALDVVRSVMRDITHKDRLKAAALVLDRTDMAITRQDITVKHEVVDRDAEGVLELRAILSLGPIDRIKLENLFGYGRLMKLEARMSDEDKGKLPILTASFVEIDTELENLLKDCNDE